MVVKIRFGAGRKLRKKPHKNQHVALALGALITPGAVMALVLALWRLAADLRLTAQFPISDGIFSHWQIWLVAGLAMQSCAILLNRYGKSEPDLRKSGETSDQTLAETRF
ncbi:MAG TPA: hypothetical protein VKX49_05270 [Bryobacteraceae bacterium]|nr:hypothetical protein [Bryobacteraceae bacterium]